jgi:quercetin dioxygenase-like cupin family protein
MDMRRALTAGIALMVAAVSLTVGSATATPGSGSVIPDPVASGTIADRFKIQHHSGEGVQVLRMTFSPGSSTGWHSHPGKTMVVIQSGEFTLYRANDPTCTGTTYGAGEGFVERPSSVHVARNEGLTDVVLAVVYFDAPPGTSPRIDQPDPGTCDF